MCKFAHRVYPSDATAPTAARHLCTELVGQLRGDTTVVADAALVVTELVTNALRAGSTEITVDIAVHRDHILTAVSDDAAGQPEIQNPSRKSDHGRGLHIVSVLSRRWGTLPLPAGKQVWAELPIDESDAWECSLPLTGPPSEPASGAQRLCVATTAIVVVAMDRRKTAGDQRWTVAVYDGFRGLATPLSRATTAVAAIATIDWKRRIDRLALPPAMGRTGSSEPCSASWCQPYERAPANVTSNKSFGRWGEVSRDDVVAAMIDRRGQP